MSGTTRSTDIAAELILISGCQDNQLSSDGDVNGLFAVVQVGDVPLPAPKKYHSMEIPADLKVDQEIPIVLNDAARARSALAQHDDEAGQ